MRRRQAYAQPLEIMGIRVKCEEAPASIMTGEIGSYSGISMAPVPKCECGKEFESWHGLKIHKARQKH